MQASTLSQVRRVLLADGRLVLLPVAWITGGNLLERAAAWLFRITGEAGHWDGRFTQLVRAAGFEAHEERVTLLGAEVMLVVSTPLERD